MSASMTPRTVVEQRRRRRVSVVVLRDRRGVLTGDITGGARPDLRELQRLYSDILHRDAVLLSAHRRLAPIAAAAQARGRIHVRVTPHERDPLVHIENVMGHTHRLRVWLERFRGVATRYLSNYLSWYRHLEPLQEDTAGVHFLARCCGSVYQQLSRTEPDAPALGHAPGPPRSPPVPPTGPQPPPPNVE